MMNRLYVILCALSILGTCSVPARAQIDVPPPMSDMGASVPSLPTSPSVMVPTSGDDASRVGVFARHVNHVNPSVSHAANAAYGEVNGNNSMGDFTTDKVVRPTILGGKNPLVTLNNHPLPQGIDVAGLGHEAPGVIMTQGTAPQVGGPVQIVAPMGKKGVFVGGTVVNVDGMNDTFNGSYMSFDGSYDSLGD